MSNLRQKIKNSAVHRLVISLLIGIAVALVALYYNLGAISYLIGWDAAVIIFVIWIWLICWPMDHHQTAKFALREDPSNVATDVLLISASVASLVGVVMAVFESRATSVEPRSIFLGFISILSVVLAWTLIHTIYTLRYAKLYYSPDNGAKIEFSNEHLPSYVEFAYFSITIGMTFQVTDTFLRGTLARKAVLRHALLSYLFNTVIIATTINLIANFGH